MIDLRVLRDDPDRIRHSQQARGESSATVDSLLAADAAHRSALQSFESLRAEQKQLGKRVARADGDEKQELLTRTKQLAADVKAAEAAVTETERTFRVAHLAVPNIIEGAPPGGEEDYAVLREVGERTDPRPCRDHLEIGELLGAIDTERAARTSGSRFYYLTGSGALLQFAMTQMAMRLAVDSGFTPVVPPVLVKPDAMEGTGFLGAHADEIYYLDRDERYLVGTSEVSLAAYHAGETLDLAEPIGYAGQSTCYRREAGSYGKDTRGIIRTHQFDKTEMFVFCRPQDAAGQHLRLLDIEEQMLAKMELPYRVIDTAAGDLGSSAARKYDCEAWLPSQQRYVELTSTSNCTTFQSRRLRIRYRDEAGKNQIAATLNGTLVTTRWMVPLLENHQQPDGSVRVPRALRTYLGREVLEPVK